MVRRPYRTTVRPFRDSDEEAVLHWYLVPWENGTLPYPCRINSLDWRPDQLNPSPVGEVSWEPRLYDGWGRIVPPPPGDHVCGERRDFEEGGAYLPDEPPVERDLDGIPTCCRPAIDGIDLGGEGIRIPPEPFSDGAVVMGGTGILADVQELSAGAVVMGGEGTIGACRMLLSSSSPPFTDIPSSTFTCDSHSPLATTFPNGFTLASTAPVGTPGTWNLFDFLSGATWQTTGWDGLGCRVFTLTSGSWPGTITVCHDP